MQTDIVGIMVIEFLPGNLIAIYQRVDWTQSVHIMTEWIRRTMASILQNGTESGALGHTHMDRAGYVSIPVLLTAFNSIADSNDTWVGELEIPITSNLVAAVMFFDEANTFTIWVTYMPSSIRDVL